MRRLNSARIAFAGRYHDASTIVRRRLAEACLSRLVDGNGLSSAIFLPSSSALSGLDALSSPCFRDLFRKPLSLSGSPVQTLSASGPSGSKARQFSRGASSDLAMDLAGAYAGAFDMGRCRRKWLSIRRSRRYRPGGFCPSDRRPRILISPAPTGGQFLVCDQACEDQVAAHNSIGLVRLPW
jgi:hypothetical protein